MKETCYIFGAGEYGALTLTSASLSDGFVVAADGGYERLRQWGISPDLLVGDFDSLGRVPENMTIVRHPVMKDDTDMMLAVQEGLERGCSRFLLFGGLGRRLDHTLANLHILAFLARRGCPAFLLGEDTAITAVHSGTLTFAPEHTGILSLFAWGGAAEGVTLTGLLYPLENAVLTPEHPLGVSNEFLGRTARVSVADGTLIAVWQSADHTKLPAHR